MYEKNLTEDLRLRLSSGDMDFLRTLSSERSISISECIRSIIGEYRRSLDTIETIKNMMELAKQKEAQLSHGDTETDKHDIV